MGDKLNSNPPVDRTALQSYITHLQLPTRVASNTLILLGANLSSAILGFLIAVAIGRGLGADGLGRYSLVMSWTFGLGIFAEFGLNTLITRDVARDRNRAAEYLSASLLVKTILSAVFVTAFYFAAPAVTKDNSSVLALQLGSILIWLNALYGSFTALFRAFELMRPVLILNVGGLALQFAGTIWLTANEQGIISLIALAVVVQVFQTIGAYYFVCSLLGLRLGTRPEASLMGGMLRAAFPFAFAGIISAVEARANYALLASLQNENSVGLYSAASRFTEAVRVLPYAFFGALFPAFAAMNPGSDHHFRRARFLIFLFSIFSALALTAAAPFIMLTSFGVAFVGTVPTLIILAWSLVPSLVNGLTLLFKYAHNEESFTNKLLALSLLIQLIAAFPLIEFFGSQGAAISTLLGDVALFALLRTKLRFAISDSMKYVLPIIIFIVALSVRLILVHQTQFDGLYGQDSYAYFDYASAFKSALTHGEVPPPFFWPIGYPALVTLASLFLPIATAAQAVSVIAGSLTATTTFLLTRLVLRDHPHAGWFAAIAGLVVACAGQMMVSSLSAMSDALALFGATFSAYALVRFHRYERSRWIALAAFALGFAVTTRWIYALLIPVWVFATYSFCISRYFSKKHIAYAFIFFLLPLAPQLWLMLYHSSHGILSNSGDLLTVRWNLTNAWAHEITNGDGHFIYPHSLAAFYAQPIAHPSFVHPLLTPFILIGAWSLRREKFHLTLLSGWIIGNWIFLSGIAWENPRFSLAFFPSLAVLVGVGVARFTEQHPRLQKVTLMLALSSIILTSGWSYQATEKFVTSQRADLEIAGWTTRELSTDATVITFGITETLRHRTRFQVVEIYNETPDSILDIVNNGKKFFVLLDLQNIESQWKNLSPEINWRALQSDTVLNLVATHPPYTLFEIVR